MKGLDTGLDMTEITEALREARTKKSPKGRKLKHHGYGEKPK